MIKSEEVLEFINNTGFASTADICRQFNVSDSTARRIFTKLADSGSVSRYHGGVISNKKHDISNAYARISINEDLKKRIAAKAAQIIKDGQTIILLSGSTIYHLCKSIKNKNITVITNSMLVFDELRFQQNIQLILLGGYYNRSESETAGYLTNSSPSFYRADYLFMGTSGFDEYSGFTNDSYSIDVYRACLSTSRHSCIVTESSKYNRGGTAIALKPSEITYLFTDSNLPPIVAEHFSQKYNVHVVCAD